MVSVARLILNEQLNILAPYMKGKALDVGGEPDQVMEEFNRPDIDWKYLNLDERYKPDIVGSAEDVPAEDDSFDTLLLIEILEHVEEPIEVLQEMKRILKPEGLLFISMPFMYRHHRNPTDFIRWTHEKLFLEIEKKLDLSIEVFLPRGGWLYV